MSVINLTVSESVTFGDGQGRSRFKIFPETVNFNETFGLKQNPTKYIFSESLSFSDSIVLSGKRFWYNTVTDSLVFTEVIGAKGQRLSIIDSMVFSEPFVVRNMHQSLVDSMVFTDSNKRAGTLRITFPETVTFVDSIIVRSNRITVTETLNLVESLIGRPTYKILETLTFVEVINAVTPIKSTVDTVVFKELIGFSRVSIFTESLSFIETFAILKGKGFITVTDRLTFVDVSGLLKGKPLGDSLNFSENTCVCMVRGRLATETLTFKEGFKFQVVGSDSHVGSVTVGVGDGFEFVVVYEKLLSDNLKFAESLLVLRNNQQVEPGIGVCCAD